MHPGRLLPFACVLLLSCSFDPEPLAPEGDTQQPGDSSPVLDTADSDPPGPQPLVPVAIPEQGDWTLQGIALEAGAAGAWDSRLYGQISPSAVVKKDGTWLLYYVGADGDRGSDGGPSNRALGVATSSDGIHFTKHDANPVLTHLPHGNEEEGVFSAGATVDEGRVVLYYSAIWAANATTESVQGYVSLASSDDGLQLEDHGPVVSWDDPSVWGYGDELFPLGVLRTADGWFVYYGAKGNEASWDLGGAWGGSTTQLPSTTSVLITGDVIGGCDPVRISEDEVALFVVRDFQANRIEVRRAPYDNPAALGEPERSYSAFDGTYRHTTVMLDRETSTWFMYQSTDSEDSGNHVVVRTAPMVVAP